jgi:ribose-phosphate pyrophosphokinase
MLIFGWQNDVLAKFIRTKMGLEPIGEVYTHIFPSGEKYCQYHTSLRGEDVYLVQPTVLDSADDNIFTTLVMADAAKRAGAKSVRLIIPYFFYARQDRKDKPRTPITAKMLIDMYTACGIDHIIGTDIHCLQIQGMASSSLDFDHLTIFNNKFFDYLKENSVINDVKNLVVVAPDAGSVKRVTAIADYLNSGFAFVNKKRISENEIKSSDLIGDSVKGKEVIIIDDLTESCNTLIKCAERAKEDGASKVTVIVVHCAITPEGLQNLLDTDVIDLFVTTDTHNHCFSLCAIDFPNLIYNVAGLYGEVIKRTQNNESITSLFDIKGF